MSPIKEDKMKRHSGAFQLDCATSKDPSLVLKNIEEVLQASKIAYKKVSLLSTSDGFRLQVLKERPQVGDGDHPAGGLRAALRPQPQAEGRRAQTLQAGLQTTSKLASTLNIITLCLCSTSTSSSSSRTSPAPSPGLP